MGDRTEGTEVREEWRMVKWVEGGREMKAENNSDWGERWEGERGSMTKGLNGEGE